MMRVVLLLAVMLLALTTSACGPTQQQGSQPSPGPGEINFHAGGDMGGLFLLHRTW